MISLPLSALLERLSPSLPKRVPIYLVGGAVRDVLLNRGSQDLDFIVHGGARKTARAFANAIGADYYPLSDTIDAGRVLYTLQFDHEGESVKRRFIFDFTALRGDDLENDLRGRDFTINAIALDLSTNRMIDPLHGGQDIRDKIIRACSPNSFTADPVRILRAVRLANQLGFQIDPQTLIWQRDATYLLQHVSAERLRDEIMHIYGGDHPERALRILDSLQILEEIMPEITHLKEVEQPAPHLYDVWHHTLTLLRKLTTLIEMLSPEYSPDAEAGYSSNLIMGLAATRLGRFRRKIGEHFTSKDYPEFSRRALLIFAALYHDAGKVPTAAQDADGSIHFSRHDQVGAEIASSRARALHMSNDDVDYLETVIRHHMRPYLLNLRKAPPTRRSIYRFYRDTGSAGVDICLLALADYLAIYDYTISQTAWSDYLELISTLLENWWYHHEENISPLPLVNGDDLIEQFNIKPGPVIGELLELVREGQVSGDIQTRTEAFQLVAEHLAEMNVKIPPNSESDRS